LKVTIEKGAPHGEEYTFHGEADEIPGAEAGDVVVQVIEKPHPTFKRRGGDLLLEKEITLLEALTGCEFVITHLDGRGIKVVNGEGEVIKPDEIKTIDGLGMPFHKKSYNAGNLFILFKIAFPVSLQPTALPLLTQALTGVQYELKSKEP